MEIHGRSAIVFGGGSGLGEATARRLAQLGASVTVVDLNGRRAELVAAAVGGRAVSADVTDEAAVQAAVDSAAAATGSGLRIAVCCAGVGDPLKLLGREGPTPLAQLRRVIDVNLIGTLNALRLAAWAMTTNEPDAGGERGVCVTTASVAAFEGQVGQVAYSASKGGVAALTLPVARELARFGIRLVSVAPGLFNTPMLAALPQEARESLAASVPFPPRLGEPSEYAQLVEQIIVNPMLNGETIRLDGAIRMAPR